VGMLFLAFKIELSQLIASTHCIHDTSGKQTFHATSLFSYRVFSRPTLLATRRIDLPWVCRTTNHDPFDTTPFTFSGEILTSSATSVFHPSVPGCSAIHTMHSVFHVAILALPASSGNLPRPNCHPRLHLGPLQSSRLFWQQASPCCTNVQISHV